MHTTLLDRFGGVAKHMPVTAILFFVATAAICALPPFNGFVGEYLIYLGMLDGVRSDVGTLYCAAGIFSLALIGGLVVMAFTKLYSTIFLGSPRHHHVAESEEVDSCRRNYPHRSVPSICNKHYQKRSVAILSGRRENN